LLSPERDLADLIGAAKAGKHDGEIPLANYGKYRGFST
jgi:hypothetical protein